jgi:hypothetical protein
MLADWLLRVDETLNFAQTLAPSWLTGGRASLTCSPLVSADLPQMTERCVRERVVASVWAPLRATRSGGDGERG